MQHFILIIQDKTIVSQYYVKGHTVSLALNATVQVLLGLNTVLDLESSCLARVAQFDWCNVLPLMINKLSKKKYLRVVNNTVLTPL